MNRWRNIIAVVGFLIVLAFVAERFFLVRAPLAGLSWTDLRDLAHDLVGLGLGMVLIAAVLLVIIVIFWSGYSWWREIRPKQPKDSVAEPQYSFAVRVRHVVELAVLSTIIGSAAAIASLGGRSYVGAPGLWVAGRLYKPGRDLNLGLFIVSASVVDAVICFVILWGGYLQWMWYRQRRSQ